MLKNLVSISLLLGSLSAPAATLNNLYFGLDNMRGFAEDYWWFLSDGRVLHGLPTTGIAPEDFENACKASPPNCGNYTLSGDKLVIKYRSGKPEVWGFKTLNGGIQLNYLILTPVRKYPAGARLNGSWSRPYSSTFAASSSSAVTVTSPTFLAFKSDGTYTRKNMTAVDTTSGVKGANATSSQTSQAGGTYSIKDNVLMLIANGKSERHMIFPVAGDNLNIDGHVYKKEK
jgi:hypothetical protein